MTLVSHFLFSQKVLNEPKEVFSLNIFSEYYVNDIVSGACEPNNTPIILKETASTAWVDAKSVLGATASNFAMDIAIAKAKATGVGWVVVKGKI